MTTWDELRPRFLSEPTPATGRRRAADFGDARSAALNGLLRAGGHGFNVGRTETTPWVLVEPGVPSIDGAECHAVETAPSLVQRELRRPAPDLRGLFARGGKPFPCGVLRSGRELGTDEDARARIGAATTLSAEDREGLLAFVAHFPAATFYRESAAFLDAREARHQVRFPSWLRAVRQAVAFVLWDGGLPDVRFGAFEGSSPGEERLERMWYAFDLRGVPNPEVRALVKERERLFPLADWLETGDSTLAIRLAGEDDRRVYEYDLDFITLSEAHRGAPHPVFTSYGSMLASIRSLRSQHGHVLEASP